MPPKKGKKKKGKKSSKKSGVKPVESKENFPILSNENKEIYLIQIKDLEKQIEFYQQKCDDLEIINEKFDAIFSQTNSDKVDISEHLDMLLKIRVDEITKLNSELSKLQEQRDQDKQAFEEQIQLKKKEFDDIVDQLTSDQRIKSGQLASMNEFKIQKEELLQKFSDIQEEIGQLEEMNEENVYQKERARVLEMDKLKKEMISRVNSLAAEFRKVSNRQMAEINKKTIIENVELSTLIRKKSEKTIELLEENDRLRLLENENRRQIEISEVVEKEFLKKNEKAIEKIKYWVEECRNSGAEISQLESEEYAAHTKQIQAESQYLTSQSDTLKNEFNQMQSVNKQMSLNKDDLESEIKSSREKLRIHERLIRRIKNALLNIENLMVASEEFTEGEIILRRQNMVSTLLDLLNTSAKLGFGLEPRQIGKQMKS